MDTEKQLLLAVSEGDELAFRQLFHLYFPQLRPMIWKITKSESAAEDILQETFLKVWISRDKLPEIENPRAWILRIAYFQAFTFLRRKVTHQKAIMNVAEKVNKNTRMDNAEEIFTFRALQATVKQAVLQLPAQQKKVYQLSREQGLKNKEIAIQMGLSEQSVKNTLVRALKFVRDKVEKAGHVVFSLCFTVMEYFNSIK